MANRYFVDGGVNANWSTVGNWSLTSGGAGGQTVPTSSDDVYFDTNSVNCTVDVAGECDTLTISKALTFTIATTLTVYTTLTITGAITDTFDTGVLILLGNLVMSSNHSKTLAGTASILLSGTGNQTITGTSASYAAVIAQAVTVTKNTGTFANKARISFTAGLTISAPNHPAITNVKNTTVYGPNNDYIGSLVKQGEKSKAFVA